MDVFRQGAANGPHRPTGPRQSQPSPARPIAREGRQAAGQPIRPMAPDAEGFSSEARMYTRFRQDQPGVGPEAVGQDGEACRQDRPERGQGPRGRHGGPEGVNGRERPAFPPQGRAVDGARGPRGADSEQAPVDVAAIDAKLAAIGLPSLEELNAKLAEAGLPPIGLPRGPRPAAPVQEAESAPEEAVVADEFVVPEGEAIVEAAEPEVVDEVVTTDEPTAEIPEATEEEMALLAQLMQEAGAQTAEAEE